MVHSSPGQQRPAGWRRGCRAAALPAGAGDAGCCSGGWMGRCAAGLARPTVPGRLGLAAWRGWPASHAEPAHLVALVRRAQQAPPSSPSDHVVLCRGECRQPQRPIAMQSLPPDTPVYFTSCAVGRVHALSGGSRHGKPTPERREYRHGRPLGPGRFRKTHAGAVTARASSSKCTAQRPACT